MSVWYKSAPGVYQHQTQPVYSKLDGSGNVRYYHNKTDQEVIAAWELTDNPLEARTIGGSAQAQLDSLQSSQVGVPVAWPVSMAPPTDFILAHGQSLDETLFPDLFAVYGAIFGSAGAGFFNNIDLRGYFLRGRDAGAGIDPDAASRTDRGDGTTGDNAGTIQQDSLQGHEHSYGEHRSQLDGGTPSIRAGSNNVYTTSNIVSDGVNGTPRTGTETRAKNKAIDFIVRYQ